MGRRTWHTSEDGDGHGGPVLGHSENGPQRTSQGERGGPVHHTMVVPQHETQGAKWKKLSAQLRTRVVAVPVGMLKKRKTEHRGMDSDPFLFRILSPSIRFLHRIY